MAMTPRMVEGRQRLGCVNCGFVLYRDPKVACGVLVEREGRVLLLRRTHNPGMGRWCLPAGFEDAEESPEACARREAREETGLDVTLGTLLGIYYYDDDPRGPGIFLCYLATIAADDEPRADDGADAAGFFAPDALPPLSAPIFQRIIGDWVRMQPLTSAAIDNSRTDR